MCNHMYLKPLIRGIFFLCFLGYYFKINAQSIIVDSVSLGTGYANRSFYSLSNGEVLNSSNLSWDLAFDLSNFGSSIRINDSKGLVLYNYPNGDTNSWNNIDTTGIVNWYRLYNTDTSWSVGAFDRNIDLNNNFDVGWGIYNMMTHHITGDSIYVLPLVNGNWKKIQIIKLASGTYHFKYANIDGSDEHYVAIKKSDYPNKNFVYYSLENHSIIDLEPSKDTWEIVFTKYVTEISPNVFYSVTGVLQNKDVSVAKAYPISDPLNYTQYQTHNFSHLINTIGYDWKSFNGQFFVLKDSLCYFVKDLQNQYWKMIFSKFEGSGTGKIVFQKQLLGSSKVNSNSEIVFLQVFPNPASNYLNIVLDTPKPFLIEIIDPTGKSLQTKHIPSSGFISYTLDVEQLEPGIYFLKVLVDNQWVNRPFVIQK